MTCLLPWILVFLTLSWGCKDRSAMKEASTKSSPELMAPLAGIEAFTRQNFLESIQGRLPPVGRATGVVLTVKLSFFGGYDSHALGEAVVGLTDRIQSQLKAKATPSYVIVAIDSARVFAPASVVTRRIVDEDSARRTQVAQILKMKEEDLRDIVIFSDDAASWYMTQYGIQSDLALTLIDRTGRPVESCSVPAEIARCLASFDKIIIAESTGRVRPPAVRSGE